MIKVIDSDNVIIEYNGDSYDISDNESYKEFLVLITNPDPEVSFPASLYDIDDSISDPNLQAIAKRYSDFFKSFIDARTEKLEEAREQIVFGQQAINTSVEVLEDSNLFGAEN